MLFSSSRKYRSSWVSMVQITLFMYSFQVEYITWMLYVIGSSTKTQVHILLNHQLRTHRHHGLWIQNIDDNLKRTTHGPEFAQKYPSLECPKSSFGSIVVNNTKQILVSSKYCTGLAIAWIDYIKSKKGYLTKKHQFIKALWKPNQVLEKLSFFFFFII